MSGSGVLIIDKPASMTSHDVVAKVRKKLGTRKVGHAGTLDPDVTGVLVLCVGDATRLLEYAAAEDKTYIGTACFGIATDTDDATGSVIASEDASHLTENRVLQAANQLVGAIAQMVPKYSAVHIDGKRAYDYARQGVDVALPVRTVNIYEFAVANFLDGQTASADFRVHCGKGTYVRALCRDWGELLGVPAHMRWLRRTASGPFREGEAVALQAFLQSDCPEAFLLSPLAALRTLPSVVTDVAGADRLANGLQVVLPGEQAADRVSVVTSSGELVAVCSATPESSGRLRLVPKKVFWKRARNDADL